MDYQEAKRLLHPETTRDAIWEIADKQEALNKINEACLIACEAIDELQEYKSLGSLEEVQEHIQELGIYKENEIRNLSRTDRLMDECTYRHENGNCLKVGGFCTSVPLSHCQRYKDWYAEYRGYKQIGTLEEVREAMEKWNECKNCGYKIHSEGISKLNSCNDCGLANTCVKRPEYGKYCRINCYDWRKRNER